MQSATRSARRSTNCAPGCLRTGWAMATKRVALLFDEAAAAALKRATDRAGLSSTQFCRQAVAHRVNGLPLFDQEERRRLADLCRALDDARGVLERLDRQRARPATEEDWQSAINRVSATMREISMALGWKLS